MLHLALSNRFEILLDALVSRLAAERPDPFTPQQVIVPSAGIARRVELALADRIGVCANLEFAYPAQWLWAQIRHVVPEVAEESPFAPEVLAWRIYEVLGDAGFVKDHPRLAVYLGRADAVMRLDLARRIAQLLEQYITYRPEFPERWSARRRAPLAKLEGSAAEDDAWQAALWRRIAAELGTSREHPSATFFKRIESMGPEAPRIAGLPHSAHFFCLPSLAPLYLEMLRKLARWTELHLYTVNPCAEYWFEIVDPSRLAWLEAKGKSAHHEIANPLLAAWGRQTQAHIDLLLSGDGELEESDCAFEPAAPGTLLARVQNAILRMEDPAPGSVALSPDDRSLEVHACHSLTRELEVLQDQLLALFAGPNPPTPDGILVVTPDLDAAAPLIDAVFGTATGARHIPFAISGQPQRRVNVVARAFDALLALAASRHAASSVADLLRQEPIRRRFALDTAELETIHDWLRESGIRWGMDGAERTALGLPAEARHTFSDGLHRLYLAYATGEAQAPLGGRIGAGNPEGREATALGGLWRFAETLRRTHRSWREPRTARDWRTALSSALGEFVAESPEWAEDLRAVRLAIARLHGHMTLGGLRSAVPLEVVRAALGELLDDPARGAVPSGKVTFTTLGGLRFLPYRVVCAIGLDDGAFPTNARALEFDLMALEPRRGDRQRRIDERNLFLDLLLAARERLYLSYTGRSVHDNSPKPPSVLVAELLEYAARAAAKDAAAEVAIRSRLVVRHPLQPFALDYFLPAPEKDDARLVSSSVPYCEALRDRLRASAPQPAASAASDPDDDAAAPERQPPFFTRALPAPDPHWRRVRLDQLERFFAHPCNYLLRERLGIHIPRIEEALQDDEPFVPERLQRHLLAERLLPAALEGLAGERLRALAGAGIEYPAGALGEAAIAAEIREITAFAAKLKGEFALPPATHAGTLQFDLGGEDWQLEGAFAELRGDALVRWRFAKARPKDHLAGWIAHLFLCATRPAGGKAATRWHSRNGEFGFSFCEDARERLGELLALYREGLAQPLRFFPQSAWAYAQKDWSESAARSKWSSTYDRAFPEGEDPAHRLALRGIENPLDGRFFAVARQVLEPLVAHFEETGR